MRIGPDFESDGFGSFEANFRKMLNFINVKSMLISWKKSKMLDSKTFVN